MTATMLGRSASTATSIDIEHLDELCRKAYSRRTPCNPAFKFVCATFARFDDAALFSRIGEFETQFVRGLSGDLAAKVRPPVAPAAS